MENIQGFLEWLKFWLVELVEMVKHVLHWADKTFPEETTI